MQSNLCKYHYILLRYTQQYMKHDISIIINLIKHNKTIGSSKYFITNNTALLSSINIYDNYKYKGYGNRLMYYAETFLMQNYNINRINTLAWQPSCSTDIVDFYTKNGFITNPNSIIQTYDDSVTQFDLFHMHKILGIDNSSETM